ncbi:N-myc protein, partial [Silurus asotus]
EQKMPAVMKNSDLEFDSFLPCFYPDEDDFYLCGPGEDIWKKFELLPTPPLSPSRAALASADDGVERASPGGILGLGDPLDWASELLLLPPHDADDEAWRAPENDLFGACALDDPVILQDCMWSGFSAREKLERAVSEKLGRTASSASASTTTNNTISTTTGASTATSNASGASGLKSSALKAPETNRAATECVDPAVVFPFPVHKRNGGQSANQARSASLAHVDRHADDTPSDSAPKSRHVTIISRFPLEYLTLFVLFLPDDDVDDDDEEEDEEDEEEEEEDEEEIDVVTVEKRRSTSSKNSQSSSPASRLTAGAPRWPQELILKRTAAASIHQQQHNYAAPSPYSDDSDLLSAPPSKKHRSESGATNSARKPGLCLSIAAQRLRKSGSGSDSEDNERRRNHNILERQRRNDLRSSFLTLRDQLPELAKNDKAAKVLILKKAAEYVSSLEAQQLRLRQEKDKLQARRQHLLRRLEQARTR